jgi:preprotein translocase subunit SecG
MPDDFRPHIVMGVIILVLALALIILIFIPRPFSPGIQVSPGSGSQIPSFSQQTGGLLVIPPLTLS